MSVIRHALKIALLCWVLSAPAAAQTIDPDRLEALSSEQEKEAAREAELRKNRDSVRTEISGLKKNLTQLASEASKIEREGQTIARQLTNLEAQQTTLKSEILDNQGTLIKLLAALQRVEANPPPALAVSPGDAANAARAGQLMSNVSLQLQSRADTLKTQITELETLKANITSQKSKLERNQASLKQKRGSIKNLVTKKSALEKSISADQAKAQARMTALASEADTLRDLIRQFERAAQDVVPRLKPKPGEISSSAPSRPRLSTRMTAPRTTFRLPRGVTPFGDLKGRLTAPVTGQITKSYSAARKGLTVTTRDKAQVVAPAAARVEFSGPFKNYDNVVILNTGDGYFVLLTGLGEIYASAGDVLTQGEPVGLMPFNAKSSPELYIEFRKNGSTINPTPWLGTAFARR